MPPRKRSSLADAFSKRLLAYVDILGWKELMYQKRTPEVLNAIGAGLFILPANVQTEASRKRIFERSGFAQGTTIRANFFSDTFVYSCEPSRDDGNLLVDRIQKLCGGLLGNGLLPRGAIVVGDLLHSEEGSIVGRALVEAHRIETSVAKYPRVVVSKEAAPLLVCRRPSGDFGPPQVRTDRSDGLRYLDLFQSWTRGKRPAFIREEIVSAKSRLEGIVRAERKTRVRRDAVAAIDLRAKRQWMLNYLDEIADEPDDVSITPYRVDPTG